MQFKMYFDFVSHTLYVLSKNEDGTILNISTIVALSKETKDVCGKTKRNGRN